LLSSIPKLNKANERLATIEGTVPAATNYPIGCHFATRCKFVDSKEPSKASKCWTQEPPLVQIIGAKEMHTVACHYWQEIKKKTGKEIKNVEAV
jgi:oligopeptide/dipeptide ABC transporter ATP-binding protein